MRKSKMLTKSNQAETANRSSLVAGFERVSLANGLKCPNCGKAFGAHDFHNDGDEFGLRCGICERDAIAATLAIGEEEVG